MDIQISPCHLVANKYTNVIISVMKMLNYFELCVDFLLSQSCLSISSETSEPATSQLNSEHPLLSQFHHQQSILGTSDGESDQFSTSSSSPVMLESGSPIEQLPPASHFPWLPPATHITPNHHHPFSGKFFLLPHSSCKCTLTSTHSYSIAHTHTHACLCALTSLVCEVW